MLSVGLVGLFISVLSQLGSRRYPISLIEVVRPEFEPRTSSSASQELKPLQNCPSIVVIKDISGAVDYVCICDLVTYFVLLSGAVGYAYKCDLVTYFCSFSHLLLFF